MSVNTAINSSRICSASTELNPSLMSKTHVHLMEKIKPISVIRTAILIDRKYYFQLKFFLRWMNLKSLLNRFCLVIFCCNECYLKLRCWTTTHNHHLGGKHVGDSVFTANFFFYWRCITQNCIECHRLIVFSFSFNIQVQQFCFKYALWRFS